MFFMVLNSFVEKQGRSGKARNKMGESRKSDCDLAQELGRKPQNWALMYLVSNLKFYKMSHCYLAVSGSGWGFVNNFCKGTCSAVTNGKK